MPNRNNSIEWCRVTWNPLQGECLNDAECKTYCYMERMYRQHPEMRKPIELNEKELAWTPRKPCVVFMGSRLDFLHPDMRADWQDVVVAKMARHRSITYVVLSKFPQNFANFKWGKNCWLGTTVDGLPHTRDNVYHLLKAVPESYTRFVSFEPLLKQPDQSWLLPLPPFKAMETYVPGQYGKLDWAIIGANSNINAELPPARWASTLVVAARKQGTRVLVKNNFVTYSERVKEMPEPWFINAEGMLLQKHNVQMELF